MEVWRQCVKAGSWTRHCRAPTLTLTHTCVLFATTPGSMLFGTTQELGVHQCQSQLRRFALRQLRHHVAHAVVALAHLHFPGRGHILQVLWYTLHHATHLCASINTYAQGLTTLIACTIVSAHQTTEVIYSCRHIYCCCPAHPNTRARVHTNIHGIIHAYDTHTHAHTPC